MATWTTISDTVLEPGKPARSVDALALRDNPIAITEGAAGAPRVDPIAAMAHQGAVGTIGTWAFLLDVNEATRSAGSTLAGSNLRYSNANGTSSGTPSGTWRLMGFQNGTSVKADRTSVWLRIS